MVKRKIKINGLPFVAQRRRGFTLIEFIVASCMAAICLIAVGIVFHDNQKAWNFTYAKTNNSIMVDSQMASKAFETTVRAASCEQYAIDKDGLWVEVFYYSSPAAASIDRYALLKVENGVFQIDRGIYDPCEYLDTQTVCNNVTGFKFSGSGRCIRMQMTLSDNTQDVSFSSSAVPQNQ